MSFVAPGLGDIEARTVLRLALVPAAVWIASVAGRRWGHGFSGYLGGLPMIGGPITIYLAVDHGTTFAARSAAVTLAAILGQGAHLVTFAHVGRRSTWPLALLSGWCAFLAVALTIAHLEPGPLAAAGCALAGLAVAWVVLPRARGSAPPPAIPRAELRLRLVAAFVLAAMILWSARAFGPVASGVLLSMPVTGSIMPPFTLAVYGPDALARLMRGFVLGLAGFAAFFFVVATLLPPLGLVAGFGTAFAAALAAVFVAVQLAGRRRPA